MLTILRSLLLIAVLCVATQAADGQASAPSSVLGSLDTVLLALTAEDASERAKALATLGSAHEPRLIPFLDDYRQGSVYAWTDGKTTRVVLVPRISDGQGIPLDPLTRTALGPAVAQAAFTEVPVSRKERIAAGDAINQLRLTDPNANARLAAVIKAGDSGGAANRAALAILIVEEHDARIIRAANESLALIDLDAGEAAIRVQSATTLGGLRSTRALHRLQDIASKDSDALARSAAASAVASISTYQSVIHGAQTLFSGLSAGSILIIMALGLSITFGLMGVINMAHGEMLMIGAYAALMVQWCFSAYLPPSMMPLYFPVGLVAGFIAAAALGWVIEYLVIRHLYGRPLETLLATWAISVIMIQSIRSLFGDNRAVTAPDWLTGGWEPTPDLVLPWNRLFIIVVTILSILAVWLVLNRTRIGLLLRATTQSRRTAATLGVNTRAIDGMTFAFGSGLAGTAGCALTLIGGLKPDMGQEYIIDSFLVVAAGGVGNLWGVVWSGLGLGIMNKALEPYTQTVFAKVIVLGIVILFLQWRPSGLFPAKGRLADV